jgi:hypothetical protein
MSYCLYEGINTSDLRRTLGITWMRRHWSDTVRGQSCKFGKIATTIVPLPGKHPNSIQLSFKTVSSFLLASSVRKERL